MIIFESDSDESDYEDEEDDCNYEEYDSEVEIEPPDEEVKRKEGIIRKECEEVNIEEVKKILDSSPHVWDTLFLQALSIAVVINNDQLSAFLLLHAEERHKEDMIINKTTERGNIQMMEVLLKRWDIKRFSPRNFILSMATKEGKEEMVELLLKRGAEVHEINDELENEPLQLASEKGHLSIVKLLVERGSHINADHLQKRTPLTKAINNQHVEVVKYLIEKGARIEKFGEFDVTALHHAAKKGTIEIASIIIACGANVSAITSSNISPFDKACWNSLEVQFPFFCFIACDDLLIIIIFVR